MIHINQKSETKALLIWMHGLGADGQDFYPFFSQKIFHDYEIILPNAPIKKVTLNNGIEMPSWFDIHDLKFSKLNENDFRESADQVISVINQYWDKKQKLFIGGFSQGAALSVYLGLKMKVKANGIVCFSGFAPLFDYPNINKLLPTLAIHGTDDDVIPIELSKNSFINLKLTNLTSKSYNMKHNVINKQAFDLIEFMEVNND